MDKHSDTADADEQIDALSDDDLRWCLKMLVAAGYVTLDTLAGAIGFVRRAKAAPANIASVGVDLCHRPRSCDEAQTCVGGCVYGIRH